MKKQRNPLEESLSLFLQHVAIGLLRSEQFCRRKGHSKFVESFFQSMRKISQEVADEPDDFLPYRRTVGIEDYQSLLDHLANEYRSLPAEAPPALKNYLH